MKKMTRRSVLKTSAGAGLMLASACSDTKSGSSCCPKPSTLKNEDFYVKGKFSVEKALQAYYDMMNFHGYPIQDVLKTDKFWTCDFVQNDFMKIGMAGIFWINDAGTYGGNGTEAYKGEFKDQSFGYLGHEIYLLPGQAIPEHTHFGGDEGFGPKMESWHVRYGDVEFFGEHKGAGDEILISEMPEEERPWGFGEDWFRSKYVAKRTAQSGQLYTLEDPESWHFQRAGKHGAIVSEYATYHNHVVFSKPGMTFTNTGDEA